MYVIIEKVNCELTQSLQTDSGIWFIVKNRNDSCGVDYVDSPRTEHNVLLASLGDYSRDSTIRLFYESLELIVYNSKYVKNKRVTIEHYISLIQIIYIIGYSVVIAVASRSDQRQIRDKSRAAPKLPTAYVR